MMREGRGAWELLQRDLCRNNDSRNVAARQAGRDSLTIVGIFWNKRRELEYREGERDVV
jgi:hypothetical protein